MDSEHARIIFGSLKVPEQFANAKKTQAAKTKKPCGYFCINMCSKNSKTCDKSHHPVAYFLDKEYCSFNTCELWSSSSFQQWVLSCGHLHMAGEAKLVKMQRKLFADIVNYNCKNDQSDLHGIAVKYSKPVPVVHDDTDEKDRSEGDKADQKAVVNEKVKIEVNKADQKKAVVMGKVRSEGDKADPKAVVNEKIRSEGDKADQTKAVVNEKVRSEGDKGDQKAVVNEKVSSEGDKADQKAVVDIAKENHVVKIVTSPAFVGLEAHCEEAVEKLRAAWGYFLDLPPEFDRLEDPAKTPCERFIGCCPPSKKCAHSHHPHAYFRLTRNHRMQLTLRIFGYADQNVLKEFFLLSLQASALFVHAEMAIL